MRTSSIKPPDIVKCDVRGVRFLATVLAKGREQDARLRPRELFVRPVCGTDRTRRIVTPRQIIGHYSWRGGADDT